SNRIFKSFDAEAILAEAVLKSFLRRFSLLRIWLSFAALSVLAVSLSSGGLKLLIIAVFPILLSLWVQSHWRNVIAEAFIAQFQWPDDVLMQSGERIRFWIVVPAVGFMGLVGGLQMYGLGGLLLIVPAVFVWMVINKFLSTFMMLRFKQEKG
ncbi:ABC transporter permease, partial [Paenibacillus sepulcri]|nr:ABC transporter permease [Paenibacillus sepulcri]